MITDDIYFTITF